MGRLPEAPAHLTQPPPPLEPVGKSQGEALDALAQARANDDRWYELFLGWVEFYDCVRKEVAKDKCASSR